MWKEFKYSLKRRLTVILILLVAGMVIISFSVLEAMLSALFNYYPGTLGAIIDSLNKAGLTASGFADILYLLMVLIFLASLLKGFFTSSFAWLLTRVDENVVRSSPTAPHAIYAGKKVKRFLVHILMVTTLLFAIYPLIGRVGFGGIRIGALFIALLAFMEIYGFIENIAYCLTAMKIPQRMMRALGAISTIILVDFTLVTPSFISFGGVLAFLGYLYPPYLLSRVIAQTSPTGIPSEAITLMIEAVIFALIASAAAEFGLRRWSSSPRLVQTRGGYIRLKKNKLKWKGGSKNGVKLIFMKDFWIAMRNPGRFLVPFAITPILLVFFLQLQLMLGGSGGSFSLRFSDQILILSLYLISLLSLPPAWDSFAGERRTLFILKTAPMDPTVLIRGKYLFALMKSALYIAPIIFVMALTLPHSLNIIFLILEAALVLLVSNAVGILASVSYPPAYRAVGPPPYLIVVGLPFLCAILTAIIPISLLLTYGDPFMFFDMFIPVALYVFVVLRFCLTRAAGSFTRVQEF